MHYSRRFKNERGGNQGTALMPLNFILLTHYVYLRGDPHRKHMIGIGEPQPLQTPGRCRLCDELLQRLVWVVHLVLLVCLHSAKHKIVILCVSEILNSYIGMHSTCTSR